MKRTKKLYILFGIFFVVCIAAFAVLNYEEEKELIKNSDEVILTIVPEEVTALSWEYEGESLSFHKEETWIYDEDENFPVDEEEISDLLQVFESFGASFIIEEVTDYGEYGLDEPICTIQIETETEAYEIKLGDFSSMDEDRYVSIGDENVYLVSIDPMVYYEITLADMILDDETPTFEKVTEIQVAGVDEYTIFYDEEGSSYCEEDVYFTEKDGNDYPLDTALVDDYLANISDMTLSNHVTYDVTEEEMETYGLNEPDLTLTVEYVWTDEETEEEQNDTFTLTVGSDPVERNAAETSEDEERTAAYLRIGESSIVYPINSDQYKALTAAAYDDLRHQEVLYADFEAIEQIDVTLEEEEYTLTLEKDGDDILCYYGEEEMESANIESALYGIKASSFTEEEPDGKEEISYVVHLDNEEYPEIKVELYRYDGNYCLAVVDGESISLVDRAQVVDLIETINEIVLN